MVIGESSENRARTKIVATVGPACREPERLAQLIEAGVDVLRINMAHGEHDEHDQVLAMIRRQSQVADRPLAILADLAGPKIRLGRLRDDPTQCDQGAEFRFVRGQSAAAPHELVSTYATLIDELSVGDRVMLADGTVGMLVHEKRGGEIRCEVIEPGTIRSGQGINLPGVKLSVPSLSEADRTDAVWAAQNDVDLVGLSFVRAASDVRQLAELLRSHGSSAMVVAKIEKQEALDELDEIITTADAVMVARGDLGVEIDVAQVAIVQKWIVAACMRLGKPVIVATQMLDSMQRSARPTRAEVTDVANAILDGADACMLSGETAIGDFPLAAVQMMNRIMLSTEELLANTPSRPAETVADAVHPITAATVHGASRIAERLAARLVVVVSHSGATALVRAKQRDHISTVGVSDWPAALRRMSLYWGITPLPGAPIGDSPALLRFVDQWGRADGCIAPGDRVVFVTGTGMVPGAHNQVVVHEVE